MKRSLYLLLTLLLFSVSIRAQISAPQATGNEVTNYPVFTETDNIFIFCVADSLTENGSLTATTELTGSKDFMWEKYNPQNAAFEAFSQETSTENTSQINNLADGCYRVTITDGVTTEVFKAWIFNNWALAEAAVGNSDCESFELLGDFKTATLRYYDLSDNSPVDLPKILNAEWMEGDVKLSSSLKFDYFDPPTKDTEYTLRIFDQYGCENVAGVSYISLVTKASFTASPMKGEAPLDVTFTNTSENGTKFEWYFYKDIDQIKQEFEETGGPVDSFLYEKIEIIDMSFLSRDLLKGDLYENSGNYWVKLVSKKESEGITCTDTFKLEEFIVADTSFVVAPNVFTPNGDGVNDEFVIKYWSMKSIEINIYNRWGKRVHFWKNDDVQGFELTRTESVWDGRIGGRYASPGVYYWDVVGRGRDGRKQRDHGFVHVFREKD